ncbi:conserved hypothetical protein [Uncinocarpus reesii 1704]|uniref:HbrB protein n=1 Tax=Uncinocarpus reesii (strain UAMH 1704) TaxID=336963 RepID=C4JX97_UNCRE|nr:uncharacterized protein UREG_06270 [Uncinocarpus reesii 1704]EEP81405.1 conserved hypothetical protein [Uncinocarpus reesii 1704]
MRSSRTGSTGRQRGDVSSAGPASPEHTRPTDQPPRPSSSGSNPSDPPFLPPLNIPKRSLYNLSPQIPSPSGSRSASAGIASANSSNASLPNFLRSSTSLMPQNEPIQRRPSPLALTNDPQRHRRQHSQGFFEPSLPTASMSEHTPANMAPMSASRIAAQTAMQHQVSSQQLRNRSSTIPPHQDAGAVTQKGSPAGVAQYQSGSSGGRAFAATTAANLVFPRAQHAPPASTPAQESTSGKQKGEKEKSKMKSFLKPKHIGISRDKDSDRREKPTPSPSKLGPSGLSRMVNASTTSLNDSLVSSNSSLYTFTNSSVATVVPTEKQSTNEKEKEKDKEKHRHHFLPRPKLKLKDKDDHFHLPLSSANSNSRPLDPSAPQSLYSFTPSSPSSTSFGKSVSGLDLRHGGRALREKRKMEEKASASHDAAGNDQPDFSGSLGTGVAAWSTFIGTGVPGASIQSKEAAMREALGSFGIANMAFEDAWDFLKAKLLVLFEGEEVRIAIEDLNKLVSVHILRSFQRRVPNVLVEDLRDLLQTGFASLNQTLSSIPDENLMHHLVQVWTYTYGNIVPFIQAVFFPLDLEFKGRGKIMEPHEAREFWGTMPGGGSAGEKLNVNDIILISFRDNIILNRYETLKTIFSRLSLERVNASIGLLGTSSNSGASRPGTAQALEGGSFNSQSSTALNATGSHSSESHLTTSRARAESNTSSNPDHPVFQSSIFSRPTDASHVVTETVGRVLQCICVIAGVHTDDHAQRQIEDLRKAVTHNWLGRGRTGRDRRGFVGTKVRPAASSRQYTDGPTRRGSMDGGEEPMRPTSKDSTSLDEEDPPSERMKNLRM